MGETEIEPVLVIGMGAYLIALIVSVMLWDWYKEYSRKWGENPE